jgi:hypothetical protein
MVVIMMILILSLLIKELNLGKKRIGIIIFG